MDSRFLIVVRTDGVVLQPFISGKPFGIKKPEFTITPMVWYLLFNARDDKDPLAGENPSEAIRERPANLQSARYVRVEINRIDSRERESKALISNSFIRSIPSSWLESAVNILIARFY